MKDFLIMVRRYLWPYKKNVLASVFLNILTAAFSLFSFSFVIPILQILFNMSDVTYEFIPWDEGNIKDILVNNIYYYMYSFVEVKGVSKTLLILCLSFAGISFVKCATYFLAGAIIIPVRTCMTRDLRVQIYNKIISLPISFFSQERKGDIIARMSGDVQEVEHSITGSIMMFIECPILIIIYVTMLFYISWKLTLFVLLFAPAMLLILSSITRKLRARSLEVQALWSDIMSQMEETLGGLRIVKAFVAEKKMSKRFAGITGQMRSKSTRVAIRQSSAHPVSEFLATTMIAIVLWVGGTLIFKERAVVDAPTFIYYMLILYNVIQPIKNLANSIYNVPKGLASMERIDKILDTESNIKEIENPKVISEFKDRISLEHVSFSYEDGRKVLDDVSIEIPKGKTIAIVGASGAGKSTLVDMIPRFYDIDSGKISIDGIPLKELKISSLRSLMGNVNQDPILFNDTIFNNIAFGVENATEEQVIEAAKIANAHEFIMEKEDGYQTRIGDRGVKLSGGQRQRVSIARAILKNPPILILDEATASLDTESERLVQEALERLMTSRTTIAIAHRLSTIKDADEIIVMNEGKVVERGKHDDLLRIDGYYRKLNDMQAL